MNIIRAKSLVKGDNIYVGQDTATVLEVARLETQVEVRVFMHDENATLADKVYHNDQIIRLASK